MRTFNLTIAINAVAVAIMCSVILGVSPATKAADTKARITATTDAKDIATLTARESRAVSLAAGRMLLHVEAARQAIADNKNDDAARHIGQGLKLLQIIENAVPKHKVVTDIKSADISYHNEEEVAQRYVTVFDEQHVEDIVTPVAQARKGNGSSAKLEVNKAAGGGEKKVKSAQIAPIVDFSMYRHTSMKLDMVIARRMLDTAHKAIANGKDNNADDALAVLQTDGVTFRILSTELPLVEAADNLRLAELQAKAGLHAEAMAALKLASDDLKKYELLAGESRAEEVRKLHQEIGKLTKSLEGKKDLKKALENAQSQISSWWDTAVKWFKK